ncbi:MAG TPA: alpha-hydroxy acid oxidase [Candidatus Binataceae bacterium]|nr:alpha-hydroxy acid oxidase [Candidatus Binataceae bacterium]
MKIDNAVNVEDLRRMAKRRLPRAVFDFIEGGVEDEHGIARNESAFSHHRLLPRYLVDVSKRDQSAVLFDRKYASPFGISPTGFAALFRPGADLMLAESAAAANIPFVMSGSSTAAIEAAARVAPSHTWYQLYAARDRKISEDLIRRARDAGFSTLVLTVDVPIGSKRERNIRNNFGLALQMRWSTIAEALTHPGWIARYLRHGMPVFENWASYASATDAMTVARLVTRQTPSTVIWKDLEDFRRLWPRTLVVKGILHPDDARQAAELGVDGIVVSNHGGRQLDRAPASLEMLPALHAAVGSKVVLMLDSGVRRGADIVTALCLGAQFVFVGRATVYGAAAAGIPGVRKAISILQDEIDRILAQIGCPTVEGLGPEFLLRDGAG